MKKKKKRNNMTKVGELFNLLQLENEEIFHLTFNGLYSDRFAFKNYNGKHIRARHKVK